MQKLKNFVLVGSKNFKKLLSGNTENSSIKIDIYKENSRRSFILNPVLLENQETSGEINITIVDDKAFSEFLGGVEEVQKGKINAMDRENEIVALKEETGGSTNKRKLIILNSPVLRTKIFEFLRKSKGSFLSDSNNLCAYLQKNRFYATDEESTNSLEIIPVSPGNSLFCEATNCKRKSGVHSKLLHELRSLNNLFKDDMVVSSGENLRISELQRNMIWEEINSLEKRSSEFSSCLSEIYSDSVGEKYLSMESFESSSYTKNSKSSPAILGSDDFSASLSPRLDKSKVLLLSDTHFKKFEKTFTKLLVKNKMRAIEPLLELRDNKNEILKKLETAFVNPSLQMKNTDKEKNIVVINLKLIENMEKQLLNDRDRCSRKNKTFASNFSKSCFDSLKAKLDEIKKNRRNFGNLVIMNDKIFKASTNTDNHKTDCILSKGNKHLIYLNNTIYKELKKDTMVTIIDRKFSDNKDCDETNSVKVPSRKIPKNFKGLEQKYSETEGFSEIPLVNLIAAVADKKAKEYVERSKINWRVFEENEEILKNVKILNLDQSQKYETSKIENNNDLTDSELSEMIEILNPQMFKGKTEKNEKISKVKSDIETKKMKLKKKPKNIAGHERILPAKKTLPERSPQSKSEELKKNEKLKDATELESKTSYQTKENVLKSPETTTNISKKKDHEETDPIKTLQIQNVEKIITSQESSNNKFTTGLKDQRKESIKALKSQTLPETVTRDHNVKVIKSKIPRRTANCSFMHKKSSLLSAKQDKNPELKSNIRIEGRKHVSKNKNEIIRSQTDNESSKDIIAVTMKSSKKDSENSPSKQEKQKIVSPNKETTEKSHLPYFIRSSNPDKNMKSPKSKNENVRTRIKDNSPVSSFVKEHLHKKSKKISTPGANTEEFINLKKLKNRHLSFKNQQQCTLKEKNGPEVEVLHTNSFKSPLTSSQSEVLDEMVEKPLRKIIRNVKPRVEDPKMKMEIKDLADETETRLVVEELIASSKPHKKGIGKKMGISRNEQKVRSKLSPIRNHMVIKKQFEKVVAAALTTQKIREKMNQGNSSSTRNTNKLAEPKDKTNIETKQNLDERKSKQFHEGRVEKGVIIEKEDVFNLENIEEQIIMKNIKTEDEVSLPIDSILAMNSTLKKNELEIHSSIVKIQSEDEFRRLAEEVGYLSKKKEDNEKKTEKSKIKPDSSKVEDESENLKFQIENKFSGQSINYFKDNDIEIKETENEIFKQTSKLKANTENIENFGIKSNADIFQKKEMAKIETISKHISPQKSKIDISSQCHIPPTFEKNIGTEINSTDACVSVKKDSGITEDFKVYRGPKINATLKKSVSDNVIVIKAVRKDSNETVKSVEGITKSFMEQIQNRMINFVRRTSKCKLKNRNTPLKSQAIKRYKEIAIIVGKSHDKLIENTQASLLTIFQQAKLIKNKISGKSLLNDSSKTTNTPLSETVDKSNQFRGKKSNKKPRVKSVIEGKITSKVKSLAKAPVKEITNQGKEGTHRKAGLKNGSSRKFHAVWRNVTPCDSIPELDNKSIGSLFADTVASALARCGKVDKIMCKYSSSTEILPSSAKDDEFKKIMEMTKVDECNMKKSVVAASNQRDEHLIEDQIDNSNEYTIGNGVVRTLSLKCNLQNEDKYSSDIDQWKCNLSAVLEQKFDQKDQEKILHDVQRDITSNSLYLTLRNEQDNLNTLLTIGSQFPEKESGGESLENIEASHYDRKKQEENLSTISVEVTPELKEYGRKEKREEEKNGISSVENIKESVQNPTNKEEKENLEHEENYGIVTEENKEESSTNFSHIINFQPDKLKEENYDTNSGGNVEPIEEFNDSQKIKNIIKKHSLNIHTEISEFLPQNNEKEEILLNQEKQDKNGAINVSEFFSQTKKEKEVVADKNSENTKKVNSVKLPAEENIGVTNHSVSDEVKEEGINEELNKNPEESFKIALDPGGSLSNIKPDKNMNDEILTDIKQISENNTETLNEEVTILKNNEEVVIKIPHQKGISDYVDLMDFNKIISCDQEKERKKVEGSTLPAPLSSENKLGIIDRNGSTISLCHSLENKFQENRLKEIGNSKELSNYSKKPEEISTKNKKDNEYLHLNRQNRNSANKYLSFAEEEFARSTLENLPEVFFTPFSSYTNLTKHLDIPEINLNENFGIFKGLRYVGYPSELSTIEYLQEQELGMDDFSRRSGGTSKTLSIFLQKQDLTREAENMAEENDIRHSCMVNDHPKSKICMERRKKVKSNCHNLDRVTESNPENTFDHKITKMNEEIDRGYNFTNCESETPKYESTTDMNTNNHKKSVSDWKKYFKKTGDMKEIFIDLEKMGNCIKNVKSSNDYICEEDSMKKGENFEPENTILYEGKRMMSSKYENGKEHERRKTNDVYPEDEKKEFESLNAIRDELVNDKIFFKEEYDLNNEELIVAGKEMTNKYPKSVPQNKKEIERQPAESKSKIQQNSIYHEIVRGSEIDEMENKRLAEIERFMNESPFINENRKRHDLDEISERKRNSVEQKEECPKIGVTVTSEKRIDQQKKTSELDEQLDKHQAETIEDPQNTTHMRKVSEFDPNICQDSKMLEKVSDNIDTHQKLEENMSGEMKNEMSCHPGNFQDSKKVSDITHKHKILEKFAAINLENGSSILKINENLQFDITKKRMCPPKNSNYKSRKCRVSRNEKQFTSPNLSEIESTFNRDSKADKSKRMILTLTPSKELYTPPARKIDTEVEKILLKSPKQLIEVAAKILSKNEYVNFLVDLKSRKELKKYWWNKISEGLSSSSNLSDITKLSKFIKKKDVFNIGDKSSVQENPLLDLDAMKKRLKKKIENLRAEFLNVEEKIKPSTKGPLNGKIGDSKQCSGQKNLNSVEQDSPKLFDPGRRAQKVNVKNEHEKKNPKTGDSESITKQEKKILKSDTQENTSKRNLSLHYLHISDNHDLSDAIKKYLNSPSSLIEDANMGEIEATRKGYGDNNNNPDVGGKFGQCGENKKQDEVKLIAKDGLELHVPETIIINTQFDNVYSENQEEYKEYKGAAIKESKQTHESLMEREISKVKDINNDSALTAIENRIEGKTLEPTHTKNGSREHVSFSVFDPQDMEKLILGKERLNDDFSSVSPKISTELRIRSEGATGEVREFLDSKNEEGEDAVSKNTKKSSKNEFRKSKPLAREHEEQVGEVIGELKGVIQQTAIVLPGREPMKISLNSDEYSGTPSSSVRDNNDPLDNLSDVLSNCSSPVSSICSEKGEIKLRKKSVKKTRKGEIMKLIINSNTNFSLCNDHKVDLPKQSMNLNIQQRSLKKFDSPSGKFASTHDNQLSESLTSNKENFKNENIISPTSNENEDRKISVIKTKSFSEIIKEDPALLEKLKTRNIMWSSTTKSSDMPEDSPKRFEYRFHDFRRNQDAAEQARHKHRQKRKKDILEKFKGLIQARKCASERNNQTILSTESEEMKPKVFSKILEKINYFKDLEDQKSEEKPKDDNSVRTSNSTQSLGNSRPTSSKFGNRRFLHTKKRKQVDEDELLTWVQDHPNIPEKTAKPANSNEPKQQNVIFVPWGTGNT